ncbi:MAG: formimidoylglutamase [Gammaproteobacteria bacterium]|nr:formimidoylglutamase [Gammaproteobacteria bacterium]MCW5583030.1 formimidoylglutamase [Gammaproteobacteria bacterium]
MTWTTRYLPSTISLWQGRTDSPNASCFFQVIQPLNLQQDISSQTNPAHHHLVNNVLAFALIGFCSDEGIRRNLGRIGATEGPKNIREVLAKLPFHRKNIVCYDAGDITCIDNDLEKSQHALGKAVFLLLQHQITPIILGGGHELAWGHFQGIAKRYPRENLGIINFDAHFDMRPLMPDNQGNSGTPFLQIAKAHDQTKRRFDYHCIGIQRTGNIGALFTTAENYQTDIIYAEDLQQGEIKKYLDQVNQVIHNNQIIYLSLCLDVFASAYAPGVSAPQALGLTPWQIIPFVRQLAKSGKVVSYDIAELSPKYDIDSRTAKLAANLIYEIIHHHDVYP